MARQKYNNTPLTVLPDYGKIPPQCNDMEEAVLGIIMIDSLAMNEVIDILTPESFYRESHQKIFNAAMTVFKKINACDLWTVSEHLRANSELDSVGGPVYLTQLTGKVVGSSMIVHYAFIIKQKYIQREFIRVSTELQTRSFDDTYDIAELIDFAETSLLEISGKTIRKQPRHIGDIAFDVADKVQKIQNGELKLIGTPSGFTSLDRHTTGFVKQDLYIIAARPSQGKTATAIQIAINMARMNKPVLIFSCEMTEHGITVRAMSNESGYSNNDINGGKCDINKITKSAESLQRLPIYVDPTSAISITEIRAKTRRLILQHGIQVVIVDYLQLMTGDGDSREQEVSYISRNLKTLAKDLDIPVIALSQLNRSVENRGGDKKPMLSDLRESGAIEQDADTVIFLHCPEKYTKEYEINGIMQDSKNLIIPIIAKNRNGPTGELVWKRNDYFTRIYEEESIPEIASKGFNNKSFSESQHEFENEPKF